jgi:hypothetical protein
MTSAAETRSQAVLPLSISGSFVTSSAKAGTDHNNAAASRTSPLDNLLIKILHAHVVLMTDVARPLVF